MEQHQTVDHVRLTQDGRGVIILDQTLLPNEVKYLTLTTPEEMYEAIKKLRIRGAPALGIFGGFALYALASGMAERISGRGEFCRRLGEKAEYLSSSRPTADNLSWALKRMM